MVVLRRKKVTKYRGYTTHGAGSRKKRRGAGSRGGRGMAGTGKRAGQKKAGLGNTLGAHGFVPRRNVMPQRTINVGDLASHVQKWIATGEATKEGTGYAVDLSKKGYDKLLGAGETHLKLKVHVSKWSASAEEKIKAAGGEVAAA